MRNADSLDGSEGFPALAELEDGELLALAKGGSQDAYGALFDRHSYAAHRLARHLGHRDDADDIVAEAFAKVLSLLRRGKGPETAFRAYLFTTIRHEVTTRSRLRQRVSPTGDDRHIDQGVPFGGGALDDFEKTTIRAAYESLPQRWRTVLWQLEVEGRQPRELAPLLDLSPNGIAALVSRARSGLREAYLHHHLPAVGAQQDQDCQAARGILAALVRGTAPGRARDKVNQHLSDCLPCLAAYLDLIEVNVVVGGRRGGTPSDR